jgi:hypothetical protein
MTVSCTHAVTWHDSRTAVVGGPSDDHTETQPNY